MGDVFAPPSVASTAAPPCIRTDAVCLAPFTTTTPVRRSSSSMLSTLGNDRCAMSPSIACPPGTDDVDRGADLGGASPLALSTSLTSACTWSTASATLKGLVKIESAPDLKPSTREKVSSACAIKKHTVSGAICLISPISHEPS